MKTLSPRAREAAKRIAAKNNVSAKEVIDAYVKAGRRSTPLLAKTLFLAK